MSYKTSSEQLTNPIGHPHQVDYFSVQIDNVKLIAQMIPFNGIIFKGKKFTYLEFLELINDIEV